MSSDVIAGTRDVIQQLPESQKGLVSASLASIAPSVAQTPEPPVAAEPAPATERSEIIASPTQVPLDSDIPTHLLIGHRAVALSSDEAASFGLEPLADGAVIAISMRDRIKVLSLRGPTISFPGCRLFRDDGVEATLIHLEH